MILGCKADEADALTTLLTTRAKQLPMGDVTNTTALPILPAAPCCDQTGLHLFFRWRVTICGRWFERDMTSRPPRAALWSVVVAMWAMRADRLGPKERGIATEL